MLPNPTIRRLLRENFETDNTTDATIIQVPKDEQLDWLASLCPQLDALERVSTSKPDPQGGVKDRPHAISFSVAEAPASEYRWNYQRANLLNLVFTQFKDTQEGLWIVNDYYYRRSESVRQPVKNIEQLLRFIEAVRSTMDHKTLKERRKEKLNQLKQTSMTARMKKLGTQHGFSFRIGQSTSTINLAVRIPGKVNGFHLSFPKGKLDDVIEQLPELMRMLHSFHSLSLSFRSNQKSWHYDGEWIDPVLDQTAELSGDDSKEQ